MKKLISILMITVLLFATVACSGGTSCCGSGQKIPAKKGDVSIAYDSETTKEVLAFFQANQGYVVTGTMLDEQTDYEKVKDFAKIAVVKDPSVVEKLTAAGWSETANWTAAQKANNDGMFAFTVLEAPGSISGEAAKALTEWLGGGENSEIAELFRSFGN